jgi:hypothetical protein
VFTRWYTCGIRGFYCLTSPQLAGWPT